MRSYARSLAIMAAVLPPALASAHDSWLGRADEGLVHRCGHRGGELLAMKLAEVKAVRCLDKGATRDPLGAATSATREVRLAGRCSAASALCAGGHYSLTSDGECDRPSDLAPDAVKAWAYRPLSEWVDPASPSVGAILGDELVLLPVSELAKAHEGDKVTGRVLHRGKPVPHAIVAIGHRPLGETDSAGETRIEQRGSSQETINATQRQKLATLEAGSVRLEASLSFEVTK